MIQNQNGETTGSFFFQHHQLQQQYILDRFKNNSIRSLDSIRTQIEKNQKTKTTKFWIAQPQEATITSSFSSEETTPNSSSSSSTTPSYSSNSSNQKENENEEKEKIALSLVVKDFIAGTVGGSAQLVAGHPLDTIKIRLQTQGTSGAYSGAMDCLKKTIAKEGVSGLFKGMASPLAGVAAVNAVLFAAFGEAKRFFLQRRQSIQKQQEDEDDGKATFPVCKKPVPIDGFEEDVDDCDDDNFYDDEDEEDEEDAEPEPELTNQESIIAGSFAGFVNCIVICPIELVKAKLQVQTDASSSPSSSSAHRTNFKGPVDCTRQILRTQGVRGLFKGMSATIYREVPAYGAYFGCYNLAKQLITPEGSSVSELGPVALFMAGGIGGVGCWVFSYPQDLIKSRLQTEGLAAPSKYRSSRLLFDGGFFDCARQIFREEGAIGFWRGFTPTIIRAFWANACTMLAYEVTMKALNDIFDDA